MKKLTSVLSLVTLLLTVVSASAAPPADTLAEIRKKGVLVAGVKDSLLPFGYLDEKSKAIIGYDIDFITAIADKMGVKVVLKTVTSADRIKRLQDGDIDIIAATMTKTPERTAQVDFSHAYFCTGQKFIARKNKVFELKDLEKKRVGTVRGSTSELILKKEIPSARVILFDDYPQAFRALVEDKVDAITTDEAILAGLLAKSPLREKYEIPRLQISTEPYGLGMRKGDRNFVEFVNMTLVEMEGSGEARKIFDKWFGPETDFPIIRNFRIDARADTPADTLAEVRKKGVLVAGVKDNLPPFSSPDKTTGAPVGYDIDFVNAIAKKLGVLVELKPMTSAERIPKLNDGSVDLIVATLTRTAEREKQIDFSHSYFFTGQKFLVGKGTVTSLKDLDGKRIGTATGSTSLKDARKNVPKATIVAYENYHEALKDLEKGKLFAVTTGEAILAGLLAKSPARSRLEISRLQITLDAYGMGIRRGDREFVDFVNRTLVEMEKSGEAKAIFDKWFGPNTEFPLRRNFRISAGM